MSHLRWEGILAVGSEEIPQVALHNKPHAEDLLGGGKPQEQESGCLILGKK